MKKIFIALLVLSFLTLVCGTVLAHEKVVQLTIPGCAT